MSEENKQDLSLFSQLLNSVKEVLPVKPVSKEAEERRKAFEHDITGFVKYYFPHYVKLEPASWHKALFDIFEHPKKDKLGNTYWSVSQAQADRLKDLHRAEFKDLSKPCDRLRAVALCAPREQGKSTVFSRMLLIWMLLYNHVKFSVIIRSSATIASGFLQDTMSEFVENDKIIADYGDLKGQLWQESNGTYSLKNGAALVAIGRGASVRGLVKKEKRPDWIAVDDITTDEDKYNINTLKKTYDWIFSSIANLGKDSLLFFLNTIFNCQDPQARILSRIQSNELENYLGIRLSAEIVEGETALWPEYWPIERLEEKKKEIGTISYMTEYMSLTPDDDSKIFHEKDFIWVPQTRIDPNEYQIAFGVDPNAESTDDSSICVLGRHNFTGKLLTFELWAKDKATISEMVDKLVYFNSIYHPVVIGFENVAFQNVYMKLLNEMLMPQNIYLPLKGVDAKGSKESRAMAYLPFLQNGTWEHSEKIKDSASYSKLLAFPTKGVNDGPVDAMGIARRALIGDFGQAMGFAGNSRRPSELPNLLRRYVND